MAKAADDNGDTVTTTITATAHLDLPVHPKAKTYEQLNPKSTAHEFLGPIGTLGISIVAPLTAYLLFYTCNESTGCPPTSKHDWMKVRDNWNDWPSVSGQLWEWKAVGVYLVWYAFTIFCWAVLPGEKVEGNLLRDGTRKTYTMNGRYMAAQNTGVLM